MPVTLSSEIFQIGGGLFVGLNRIFGIQNKPALNQDQLLDIAGAKDRVFVVCDFERLDRSLMEAITTSICNEVSRCETVE